jgi:uncharacterized protein (UPF0548 family)
MWHLTRPSPKTLADFLRTNAEADFSYTREATPGCTRDWIVGRKISMPGFDVDHNANRVGHGRNDFEAAAAGLAGWAMAPPWASMGGSQTVGSQTLLQFRLAGIWWLSCGRIVYTAQEFGVDDAVERRGFAYGTLPGHVEMGEERFTVALKADGSVVYEIMAFSRPRYWAARLAKPLARHWQRKFVADSTAALRRHVEGNRA